MKTLVSGLRHGRRGRHAGGRPSGARCPTRRRIVRDGFEAWGLPGRARYRLEQAARDAASAGGTSGSHRPRGRTRRSLSAHHSHDHHAHRHEHRNLHDIRQPGGGRTGSCRRPCRGDVRAVYGRIAQRGGSRSTACEPGNVHFHEVGTLDAVADIAGASLLLRELGPERVVVSPVRLGYGTVRCAHGQLPVPAPATAALIRGVPAYAGDIEGEMCTPTGAALIRHFATEFGHMPEMTLEAVGCGLGSREYPGAANCLRAIPGREQGT